MAKEKEITIGRNPRLSELIAWAEQNGIELRFSLKEIHLKPQNPPTEAVQPVRRRRKKSKKST